jgi:outer membrane protein
MNKYFLLATAVIFIFSFPLFSQNSPKNISLAEAIEIGLKNSYLVSIAEKNVAIAKNNNKIGEAGGLPVVNANLGSNNSVSKINNPTSFLNGANTLSNNTSPSIDASWVVYEGGRVAINKKRLALLELQQQGQVKIAVENVMLAVSKNYYAVLIQKKRLDLFATLLKLSREKIIYIETKAEYGAAGEFDKIQITDAYLNDSVAWVSQYNNYQIALQNLAIAMNSNQEEAFDYNLTDTVNFALPTYDVANLKTKLLTNNQKISNLKTAELLASNQIKLQKVGYLPKITLSSSVSDQFTVAKITGLEPRFPSTWRGGSTLSAGLNVAVSYNLYNGGKLKRGVDNAALQSEISILQRKEEERVQTQTLQLSIYRYENQKKLLDLQQSLVINAAKNLSLAEERYKSNVLNFFDLRTIQANYIRATNGLQDAFLNAKNTEIEITIMVGR